MSFQPVNPRPYLQARVGTEMIIRLKWGQTEYKGILESIDSYMNVLLRDTEEFIDGKQTGSLGLVLIRYAWPRYQWDSQKQATATATLLLVMCGIVTDLILLQL
ncbi:manganese transporter Smf1 [Penicillium sp. IBT 16267x]|nr:manganese transporter Smf1 [Penicillium sp. IBT 16267x]